MEKTVMVLDCGETTGVLVWRGDPVVGSGAEVFSRGAVLVSREIFSVGEGDAIRRFEAEKRVADEILGLWRECGVDVVVVEDFVLRPGVRHFGDRSGLCSPRIAWLVLDRLDRVGGDGGVVFQQPSQMGVIKDESLRRWGLWFRGKEHVRDCGRHLAVWVRNQG